MTATWRGRQRNYWKPREIVGGLMGALILLAALPAPANAYPRPGITERVSVASGGAEADGEPAYPSISANGRFVGFESKATTLVPGDTNGVSDVFLTDSTTGTTELISVADDGGVGDQESFSSSISADGRFVAFTSEAANLVAQDANEEADIFVRDRAAGTTRLVSEGMDGAPAFADAGADLCPSRAYLSFRPSISADGERVAFASWASNLVPDDNNGCPDIFVRDLATETTKRVSVSTEGEESNAVSVEPSISGDGTVVVFGSFATNLVPAAETGDVSPFTAAVLHIFVRDLAAETTERVSVSSEGTPANHWSYSSTVTHDGTVVVFSSPATNLVPADTKTKIDVFVHDRDTGRTERVSTGSDGREGNDNAGNETPAVSADGRYVAFSSDANNLAGEDRNVRLDVFVHDRLTGETQRVSLSSDGAEGDGSSWEPALSADGRRVAFLSNATNLVAEDTNGETDVFVRDRGPEVGILDLEAEWEPEGEGVRVSGRAALSGIELTSASDPVGDGAEDLGADLIAARVAARPESEDLFVRLDLAEMAVIRPDGNSDMTVAGAPGVVYGLSFEAGGVPHEVRAGGTNVTSTFSLWRCETECSQVAPLSGSIGTIDAAVVVAVPGDALPAAITTLSNVRAWLDLGDVAAPVGEVQDEVALPDSSVPTPQIDLGVALDHVPREEVAFEAEGVLQDGSFSGTVHASSLAGGSSHRAWARACLRETCGDASAPVNLGPSNPDPPTAVEPRFFFHSGGTPVNQVDKLPSGHATFDTTPPTSDQPSVGPDTSLVVNTDPGGGGDPTWTGSIGTPFDSLTLDFWQKAPLHEAVAALTGSTTIGAYYDVQVFVGDEPVILPGFNAHSVLADVATRVTHTFTTMLDDAGQEVPLFIDPAGEQVTISINGGLLEWEAATVILYDSTDYPSGFSVEATPAPTPSPSPTPSAPFGD